MPAPRPVSFRVDEELMTWVRETAEKRGLTLSAVVETALSELRFRDRVGEQPIPWVEHPSQKGGRGTPRRQPAPKPAKPTWA